MPGLWRKNNDSDLLEKSKGNWIAVVQPLYMGASKAPIEPSTPWKEGTCN